MGGLVFEHRPEAERGHSPPLLCWLAHLFPDRFIGSRQSRVCPHIDTVRRAQNAGWRQRESVSSQCRCRFRFRYAGPEPEKGWLAQEVNLT